MHDRTLRRSPKRRGYKGNQRDWGTGGGRAESEGGRGSFKTFKPKGTWGEVKMIFWEKQGVGESW